VQVPEAVFQGDGEKHSYVSIGFSGLFHVFVVFDVFTAIAEAAALLAISEFHTLIVCKKCLSPFG
jgi:hypothetical protein